MQGLTPSISVSQTVGSLAQRMSPIIAAGAGAALVFHQRSLGLNPRPSTLALPGRGSRMKPLRAMHVARRGPVALRQPLYLFEIGDEISNFPDASTTSLLGGLSHSMPLLPPLLPNKRRLLYASKAYNPKNYGHLRSKNFEGSKYPKWWWRTLSCLPYLLTLHKAWMYAENSYFLYPFLSNFEFLINPYMSVIGRLPGHVLMAYTIIAYLGVVRRKDAWPYFFRFHVIKGMLLDMALDIFMIVSGWMPLMSFWGRPGMVFWVTITSVYLLTILECIRCALAGTYADISFISETAYVQTML